jgi:hypothetical protein
VHLIQKHALSALKDNLLPSTKSIEYQSTTVADKWREDLRLSLQLLPQLFEINVSLTLKNVLQELILLLDMSANTLTHTVRGQEIGTSYSGALTAILVRWPDTTTGCSDLTRATRQLARLVHKDVIVENEMSVPVDNEATRMNFSARGANTLDL